MIIFKDPYLPRKKDLTPRVLSIDFGTKKIGLAISDTSMSFAEPLKVVKNRNDILLEIKQHSCLTLVIGYPFPESETLYSPELAICEVAQSFIEFISGKLSKDTIIVMFNENFSSTNVKKNFSFKKNNTTPTIDASVACYILQQFLDQIQ